MSSFGSKKTLSCYLFKLAWSRWRVVARNAFASVIAHFFLIWNHSDSCGNIFRSMNIESKILLENKQVNALSHFFRQSKLNVRIEIQITESWLLCYLPLFRIKGDRPLGVVIAPLNYVSISAYAPTDLSELFLCLSDPFGFLNPWIREGDYITPLFSSLLSYRRHRPKLGHVPLKK